MRILVTGHKGYVGAVLVPLLSGGGHQVIGLDSDLFAGCDFGMPLPGLVERRKDIRDVALTDLLGLDAVVHLAGLSNDPLGELDPALTLEINHGATVRLARLCKEAGVSRFVFSSSCSVYGAQGSELVREGAECRPMTAYANSKLMAERALAGLVDSSWSLTVLRSATAYGLSPRLRTDLVLNNLVGWACATGQVRLKSDGKAWRPLVHVEDMAQAFLAVLEAPREAVHNQTFNVGSTAQNFRIRDLARMVSEVVPGSSIAYAEHSFHDRRSYRVDFGKLAQAPLGYHPRWCVRTGSGQLWRAFQTQGLSVDDLEGTQYHRTRHIEQMLASRQLDASLRRRA